MAQEWLAYSLYKKQQSKEIRHLDCGKGPAQRSSRARLGGCPLRHEQLSLLWKLEAIPGSSCPVHSSVSTLRPQSNGLEICSNHRWL